MNRFHHTNTAYCAECRRVQLFTFEGADRTDVRKNATPPHMTVQVDLACGHRVGIVTTLRCPGCWRAA